MTLFQIETQAVDQLQAGARLPVCRSKRFQGLKRRVSCVDEVHR